MTLMPGDNVGGFELQHLVAVAGEHPDCTSLECRRRQLPDGSTVCMGYHCPLCDAPTNSYGHHDCPRASDRALTKKQGPA